MNNKKKKSRGVHNKGFAYPPSVQGDLFNYLNPKQKKLIRFTLRLLKYRYQRVLCISLLDYLEGNGIQPTDKPMLDGFQHYIIQVCKLRPLR